MEPSAQAAAASLLLDIYISEILFIVKYDKPFLGDPKEIIVIVA